MSSATATGQRAEGPAPAGSAGPPKVSKTIRRRRLVAVLALLLIAAGIGAAIVLLTRHRGERPPATGAAAVVPADALAYVHLSTDPTRPAVRNALALGTSFPDFPRLAAAVIGRLSAQMGGLDPATFGHRVSPWLGKEIAFAVLSTPTATADTLIVLDVRNRAQAQAFVTGTGATIDGTYDGAQVFRYAGGSEVAFAKHYLAVGQPDSVRAALDTAADRSGALQSSKGYRRAAAGEPSGRVLDAYVSTAGARRLLAPRAGIIGALGALLYRPALAGATVSVSAAPGGARLRIHAALDPTLVRLSGSLPSSFSPSLAGEIPSGAPLLLDLTGLDRVAPRLLAAGGAAGVGGSIAPLFARLASALAAEGVNVQSIVSLFHGETAVALVPTAHSPALVVVARTRQESATRAALAALQAPLAQLFPPPSSGPGQAAGWVDQQIAGVTAHQLQLGPGLQLNYAVFDGQVVVSTSLEGIADIARRSRRLTGDSSYKAVFAGHPDQVTSLLFLDFSQLLALGEQTGLTRSTRFRAMRADLEKVRAIGLESTSGEADTTAELFLQIP